MTARLTVFGSPTKPRSTTRSMLESGSTSRPRHLLGEDHVAVLAGEADRLAALGVDRHHDLFVDRSGEHHLDHFDGALVGDAQAAAELRLDAELLEHLADLRAAAMHHHRPHARGLEERDVAGEGLGELGVAHRVAAILHHDDLAVVAQHVGQRRRDQPRAGDRVQGFLIVLDVHRRSLGKGRFYSVFAKIGQTAARARPDTCVAKRPEPRAIGIDARIGSPPLQPGARSRRAISPQTRCRFPYRPRWR